MGDLAFEIVRTALLYFDYIQIKVVLCILISEQFVAEDIELHVALHHAIVIYSDCYHLTVASFLSLKAGGCFSRFKGYKIKPLVKMTPNNPPEILMR